MICAIAQKLRGGALIRELNETEFLTVPLGESGRNTHRLNVRVSERLVWHGV
jgi:hypothetical protein